MPDLTPIEQAVADGVPWTGDTPTGTLTESADDQANAYEPGSEGPRTGDVDPEANDAAHATA